MSIRKTYKLDLVELDRLEVRHYLKDLFDKLDFEPLRRCKDDLDKDEFKKMILEMCRPELGVTTLNVFKAFVFDCAKENLYDSKLLIRKINTYFDKFGW